MTPEERAAKRAAVIDGMVARGYTRERAEEIIGGVAKALFAPGAPFGRPAPVSGGADEAHTQDGDKR